jgi:Sec-independent protein translocase protein TatA
MFPNIPELLVIAVIVVAIFGLSNSEAIADFLWRFRQ